VHRHRLSVRNLTGLDAISAARFDAIEVFENDLIHFRGRRPIFGTWPRIADRHRLYQPFREIEGVSDEQFRRNLDRAERKFDIMDTLGTSMMLVCSSVSPHAIDDDARAAAQLHELAEHAARRNIRVGYEALAWASRVNHYEHAWKIVREADHPHLGIILDSFHILSLGDAPEAIADIPGDKIFFADGRCATAVDGRAAVEPPLRNFPGQGQLDLPLPRARAGRRLHGPAVARDLQRYLRRHRTVRSPSMRCARCSTWKSRRACA
jgi:4-hydroxyphenylpyruvate dioxygenase